MQFRISAFGWTRLVLSFAILLGLLSGQAFEQEAPSAPPLTLKRAIRIAIDGNPAFRSVGDEADSARAKVREVRAAWLPRVDFSQGFTRGNNPVYVFGTKLTQGQFTALDFALPSLNTPAPLDNFQTRFDGEIRFFDSGQTGFRVQGAKRLVTAADCETEQARQDLILRVVQSYYAVIVAREDLKAATEALRAAESNEQRMETMQKAGLIVDSDLLSARVSSAQIKDRAIRAQNNVELAQMQLARELGLSADAQPEPSENLAEPRSLSRTVQEWTQIALERRPALRAAQLHRDATISQKKAAQAEFGPKAGLFAGYERDAMTLVGRSGTNWTAGARLDFNIYAGGAQRARVAEAQGNENKAKHDFEWFRSGVLLEVRTAYLDATAAAQRAAAAHDAVDQARESTRIIQNRYEAGLTTVTELLRVQSAHLEAQTSYLSALHDWQVARAQLERAAGMLTPDSELLQDAGAP